MTLSYTCTGDDPTKARRVLGEVVKEIYHRNDVCTTARLAEWHGPTLHLTVEAVDRLDAEGHHLLACVLSQGRKMGVTGVVRGPEVFGMPSGIDARARELLAAGVPLRFEATSTVGPTLAGKRYPTTIATG